MSRPPRGGRPRPRPRFLHRPCRPAAGAVFSHCAPPRRGLRLRRRRKCAPWNLAACATADRDARRPVRRRRRRHRASIQHLSRRGHKSRPPGPHAWTARHPAAAATTAGRPRTEGARMPRRMPWHIPEKRRGPTGQRGCASSEPGQHPDPDRDAEGMAAHGEAAGADPSSAGRRRDRGAALPGRGRSEEALAAHGEAARLDPGALRAAWGAAGPPSRHMPPAAAGRRSCPARTPAARGAETKSCTAQRGRGGRIA